jgi:hypothetical protein
MSEPDERPSVLPDVTSPPSIMDRAVSSAPDADELDEMFDAISRPPSMPAPGFTPSEVMGIPAPPPPFVEERALSPVPPDAVASVDGVEFVGIVGLQDLTDEAAHILAQSGKIVSLAPGEQLGPFGVAIVTAGALQLAPETTNAVFATVKKGEVLFCEGTLGSTLLPRAMASQPGTRVAVFSKEALDAATMESPWVADELSEIADGYQALAGAVMGKLGSSLDEMFRPMVLEKCTVKSKSSGDTIAVAGKPMDGMYILGAGSLELLGPDGSVQNEFAVGEIVFPETILNASPATGTVRVGRGGALLLYAARMSAHELLATCPPFLEILAGF